MTSIEARALVKAREEYTRARNELQAQRLRETRYRGIPYIVDYKSTLDDHPTLTYRGISYTK